MEARKQMEMEKSANYHGEEIELKDLPEAFKTCSIHNGAVEITSDVMLVKMIDEDDSKLKSLLLYEDRLPIVTKRKTSKLIGKYSKSKCEDKRVIKHFINDIYGKSTYKRPYLSPEAMFVPIQGDSNKDVSYINLAMVNNIYTNDEGKTVIAFCGDLEVSVDMKLTIVKKTAERCLEVNGMYYGCDNAFCVDPFENWRGDYYKKRKAIIQKAMERARDENISAVKTKWHFMFGSTDRDKMEIAERAFFS